MNNDRVFFVLDPDWPNDRWLGHLPYFHAYCVHSLAKAGYKVISLSPDANTTKQHIKSLGHRLGSNKISYFSYDTLKEDLSKIDVCNRQIKLDSVSDECSKTLNEFTKFNHYIHRLTRQLNISEKSISVIFSYIDTFYFVENHIKLDDYFKFPWYGLWIQIKQQESSNLNLSFFDGDYCHGVGILEEDKLSMLQKTLPKQNFKLIPDILTNAEINYNYGLLKHLNKIAKDHCVIGLMGRLNDEKGILNFLLASLHAKNQPEKKYLFLLIGGGNFQSPEFFSYLSQASENSNTLIYLNNIQSDADFNALFNRCDIIYAAYKNFPHSSNTLSRAAKFRKPIIVSKNSLMEKRVEKYETGVSIDPDNPFEVLDAIHYLLNKRDLNDKFLKFDFKNFNRDFSYRDFKKGISTLIQSK